MTSSVTPSASRPALAPRLTELAVAIITNGIAWSAVGMLLGDYGGRLIDHTFANDGSEAVSTIGTMVGILAGSLGGLLRGIRRGWRPATGPARIPYTVFGALNAIAFMEVGFLPFALVVTLALKATTGLETGAENTLISAIKYGGALVYGVLMSLRQRRRLGPATTESAVA